MKSGNKNITVKELASILGVSISTVSKALNDRGEISAKTQRRIKKFAKEYNYQPNKLAANLKSGKTKTMGVILPSILNNFFVQVLFGIEKIANKEGYNIITCTSDESLKKEATSIELLSNGSIDGFIVAIAEETQIKQNFEHFNKAMQLGKPVVMFDRITDSIDCDKVVADDFNNAYIATKHLINIACQKIAFVSTIAFLSVGKLRMDGYRKAMQESFKRVDHELIIIGNAKNIMDQLNKLLADKKIDGIFAVDENASLSAVRTVKSKGFNIPNDISIIGYANNKIAKNLSPELTTINPQGIKMGEFSARILIKRLNNKKRSNFKTKTIKATIVERFSTKKE